MAKKEGEKLGELHRAMENLHKLLAWGGREQGGLATLRQGAAARRATPESKISCYSSRFCFVLLRKEEEDERRLWALLESE